MKFVELAREAIETFIKEKKIISPPSPLPAEFNRKAGVFVSIHKKRPTPTTGPHAAPHFEQYQIADGLSSPGKKGDLRGCIGTYLPAKENVALELINNAIDAATEDPRFPRVAAEELPNLECTVDILSRPEKIESISELDPKKYGVIVEKGSRRGLLLPDLEGAETAQDQFTIACQKAGINPLESPILHRFTVERHKET